MRILVAQSVTLVVVFCFFGVKLWEVIGTYEWHFAVLWIQIEWWGHSQAARLLQHLFLPLRPLTPEPPARLSLVRGPRTGIGEEIYWFVDNFAQHIFLITDIETWTYCVRIETQLNFIKFQLQNVCNILITCIFYRTLVCFLNVFTDFAEFSDKKYLS